MCQIGSESRLLKKITLSQSRRTKGWQTNHENLKGWNAHHSVQISIRYVDNMMTLYRLRHPSGRLPDDT